MTTFQEQNATDIAGSQTSAAGPGRSPALEFASFAGEGHGMGGWSAKTQADALARIRDFLRIHLKSWDFTDNPHGDLTAY